MNEILIAILLPIILTGIAYGIAEVLMKIFNIQHPKNTFFVYLLVFLLAVSFIPLTYMAVTSPSINTNTSSMTEDNLQEINFQNISTSHISSKITPIRDESTENIKTKTIPQRFILEISWYDYTINESNITTRLQETTDDQTSNNDTDDAETSFIASLKNNIHKTPPLLLFSATLVLIASAFVIYQLFIGKKRYLKKIQAQPTKNTYLINLIKTLSKDLHLKTPKIYTYHGAPNTFVLGHPASIVISDRLLDVLTEKELKTTLRHELTHIKHHDILLKAFIQATRIFYFYNPFIHLTAKKIFNKRELLADASYNTSHGDKVSFMEALIKIAEYTQSLSQIEQKSTPALSVSLLELSSYHPTITERFISLFKQCKKKTVLTILVSIVILLANGSAILFTHSFFTSDLDIESESDSLVNVEKQYLIEDVTYTTFYQNNQEYQGKMVHKTLYNVVSLPSFVNNSNIGKIINYILLKYYQNEHQTSAF